MATIPTPPPTNGNHSPAPPPLSSDDLHLARLLTPEVSWRDQFIQNIKDLIRPPQLPPLEVTSKPVAVKDIWGSTAGNEKKSGLYSMLVHAAVIALIFWLGTNKQVIQAVKDTALFMPTDLAPYMPPKKVTMAGGGGGGNLNPLPPTKGKLPKIAPKQYVPPTAEPMQNQPKLVMEPTIVLQQDAPIPQVALTNIGDPFAMGRIPSNGPGSAGGIGSGKGGGVGSGSGAGVGPGSGGGMGGGVYRIGGGVSAPALLSKVEPEYSEEARKAKFQGTVVLYVVVDEKGQPQQLRVVRPLGLGLDEKAIEAVQKWRFRPGFKDGRPVPVAATVEVNFRLL
ncbi:MAG: energy transducer TonB [Acidobacteriota bacterium]|jgi:TonB family protein|nr:TonB family protein [Bryobacteraceae bacterium CoA2 C42]MCA2965356.1 TonB family protein [Acidobacteriaceae bacterium]